MNRFIQLLQSDEPIILDGATGTYLMQQGLGAGEPPEAWNVLLPDRVRAMHQAYVEAGSRVLLTNSFGGSRFRLKLHNLHERVVELNRAAAELARSVADSAAHTVAVAGSIGPSGELLEPMGEMTLADARAAFAEQATGLVAGGVDVLWIETMSDLNEAKAAVDGIRQVTDLPICATLSFDTRRHTMMGVNPEEAVNTMKEWGLAAIGGNCGNGIADIVAVIEAMHMADPDVTLIAKANAGLPKWIDGQQVYEGTPFVMGEYARMVRALGAQLIGGCCGNGPEHIRAMASALERPVSAAELATLMPEKNGTDTRTRIGTDRERRKRRSRRHRRRD